MGMLTVAAFFVSLCVVAAPKVHDGHGTAVLASERGKELSKADGGWTWIDGRTLRVEGCPFAAVVRRVTSAR